MSFDNSGFKDFGPIKEQIPINEGVMPVHYGYIKNTVNPIEKDNVDVIIFSNRQYETGDETVVEIMGMFTREDGDHKLLSTDDSITLASFSEVPVRERSLILEYFGYKSKIVSVDGQEVARSYLEDCLIAK